MTKTAILLHNLGGPATEADVQPFLERLFSDPEIIRLPLSRFVQKPFARFISRRRAPEAWKNYQAIGGTSPVLPWTERQAEGMRLGLLEHFTADEIRVLPAMRYSAPFVSEAVDAAREWGATRLLSFTMYPQYSTTTTGSSERELARCLEARSWQPELVTVSDWCEDPGYLDCMAWRVRKAIDALPDEWRDQTHIVYSAHGIPLRFVNEGDPYVERIERTVQCIRERVASELPQSLAFQSRVGPIRWTQPYLDQFVTKLAQDGTRSVLIVPVAFVSDHVETLFELDIEVKHLAVEAGIVHFARARALNADPDFLGVLTKLAAEALQKGPDEARS